MRVELTKNVRGEERFEIHLGGASTTTYVRTVTDAEKLARWIFELLPGGNPLARAYRAGIEAAAHKIESKTGSDMRELADEIRALPDRKE